MFDEACKNHPLPTLHKTTPGSLLFAMIQAADKAGNTALRTLCKDALLDYLFPERT